MQVEIQVRLQLFARAGEAMHDRAGNAVAITTQQCVQVGVCFAIAGGWLSQRKGYGERLGLAAGLLLSVVGVVIMLALPPKAGSAWREDGPLPRRRRRSA